MASSRSSPPGEPALPRSAAGDDLAATTARKKTAAADPIFAALRAALAPLVAARAEGAHEPPFAIAVALSGGRDSIVLLDALAQIALEWPATLTAIHVHHGLSPHADAWARFCQDECARRGVALRVERVHVARAPGESLEAAARAERLAALARTEADVVALAHHADDQAETLLLQLMRGAGPHGLAAMPAGRALGHATLVRPLLAVPRAVLAAYAAERALAWIDDESNDDVGIKRNYLRHEIAPRLAAAFPGYPATLVRAAAHNAEAAQLLDELAREDVGGALHDDGDGGSALERATLVALAQRSPARARNVLRFFLRRHALPMPAAARLSAMLDQLLHAPRDARVRLPHAGVELGIHRGRIVVHAPPVARFALAWSGEEALELPHGVLEFARSRGEGLAASALQGAAVTVRRREGGERLLVAARRASRPLKRLLHEAGMPPWQRAALPLVYRGERLAAVPGVGVDALLRAAADEPGIVVRWHPQAARHARES